MSSQNSKRIRYNYGKCKDCEKPVRDRETKRCTSCFDIHRRQKIVNTIVCNSCKVKLPLTEFAIRTDRDTYHTICKDCRRTQRQSWERSENGKQSKLRYKRSKKYKAFRAAYEQTEKRKEYRHRSARRRRQTPRGRRQSRIYCAQRRARLASAPGIFTEQDWTNILLEQNNRCIYCEQQFNDVLPPTIDHKLPLSREGPHDKDNIVAACKPCNGKKWTKTYEEYLQHIRDTRTPT